MNSVQLSVIVPAVNTLEDLVGALEALERQREDVALEVLVVNRLGEAVAQAVAGRFPEARVLPVADDATIPEMRALAFREARGDVIGVIEDHVIVPPGWARRMLNALEGGADVVGGSVENAATETLMDWAAFLCEYSHCIPPIDEGSVAWLTGNNVVYRRDLIARHRDAVEAGKWENHLHDAIRDAGTPLICRPEIAVGHKKHYTFGEYMSQRYLYARSYAGVRVQSAPAAKRVAYGLAACALPPLLFYRTVSRILAKGKHRDLLVKSLPLIALFVTSWGWGEIVGYLFGPGKALSRVC